jgi:hypothetical protein
MIWIIYILIDAVINWWWIEKKKSVPDYLWLTIIRANFAIAYGGFILDVSDFESASKWFFFVTCSFWVLFDLTLNLLRSKSPFYIGTNSFIDRLGNQFPSAYWALKLIAVPVIIYELFNITF